MQQLLGKIYSIRCQNGAIVSSFAYRKIKSCRQHDLLFWGWYFKSSVCVCWAVIGIDATKNIPCNNLKNAKIDGTYNAKIAAGNWNPYLAQRYRVRWKVVKMQLLTLTWVFGLWTGRLLLMIHLVQGDWELQSGESLVILLKID